MVWLDIVGFWWWVACSMTCALCVCVCPLVVSYSLWPYGLEPTRLLYAWNFQARVLEWVAISFSMVSSWPKAQTQVSHIAGKFFTVCATRDAWPVCTSHVLIFWLGFVKKPGFLSLPANLCWRLCNLWTLLCSLSIVQRHVLSLLCPFHDNGPRSKSKKLGVCKGPIKRVKQSFLLPVAPLKMAECYMSSLAHFWFRLYNSDLRMN